MAINAKNIIIRGEEQKEHTKKQPVSTFDSIKAAKTKKSDSNQIINAKDKTKLKKSDLINKRKQESQFLSVMKNKE